MNARLAGRTVCVTGATGFIAGHLIAALLAGGARVRATIRPQTSAARTQHLRALESADRLELIEAPLLDSTGLGVALSGCDGLIHTAAPVVHESADPLAEIVRPAVEGTINALRQAAEEGVHDVVCTSSSAAVFHHALIASRPGRTYSENDWNDDATLDNGPYLVAKRDAERAAWNFVAREAPGMRLVTILPTMVVGRHPGVGTHFVAELFRRFATHGPVPLGIAAVDVRDVARAHVEALVRTDATGRYLCSGGSTTVADVCSQLAGQLPQYPALAQPIDAAATVVVPQIDTRRIREQLGIEFSPLLPAFVGMLGER